MKAVILAGGYGTRLMEETQTIPKPLVIIGGKPILWHIMKALSFHGINDFIICCGYKGYMIKEYFANYSLHMSDISFDMRTNKTRVHMNYSEPWHVTLVDTGEKTGTGGRLRRVRKHLGDEPFLFTYGDGVADVDVARLVRHAKKQNRLACLTAVQPPGRFGILNMDKDNVVLKFDEKPMGDGTWINGGYFILRPGIFDYIEGDEAWEGEPLARLAADRQLVAFKHSGFWRPMDTLRDRFYLEELWASGRAPWKIWE